MRLVFRDVTVAAADRRSFDQMRQDPRSALAVGLLGSWTRTRSHVRRYSGPVPDGSMAHRLCILRVAHPAGGRLAGRRWRRGRVSLRCCSAFRSQRSYGARFSGAVNARWCAERRIMQQFLPSSRTAPSLPPIVSSPSPTSPSAGPLQSPRGA